MRRDADVLALWQAVSIDQMNLSQLELLQANRRRLSVRTAAIQMVRSGQATLESLVKPATRPHGLFWRYRMGKHKLLRSGRSIWLCLAA
ncbi:MAG: hypothetical protein WCO04_10020 [Pseudomonadota bacterium]